MEKNIRARQPMYRYIVAVILGLIIIVIPDMDPSPIPLALITLTTGFFLGFIWSTESWRWGLWIAAPMFVLIGLSVVFAGGLEMFLKKDLPIMIVAIISACSGSFAGAWLQRRGATE